MSSNQDANKTAIEKQVLIALAEPKDYDSLMGAVEGCVGDAFSVSNFIYCLMNLQIRDVIVRHRNGTLEMCSKGGSK